MIYLDNASTTYMFKECLDDFEEYGCKKFYNPSGVSKLSLSMSKILDGARKVLLDKMNARRGEIIFTSGATESNNLALLGSFRKGNYDYIISAGEHPSVENVCQKLTLLGGNVKKVPLDHFGRVDLEQLKNALSPRTRLISCMFVSNETGAINDIAKISALKDEICPKALLHVDGVQGFCKEEIDLDKLKVDLFSISAHKFHGPKGVGALYVRNLQNLKPQNLGGGQEKGYRSGTENVAGICAMARAVKMTDIQKNKKNVQKIAEKMKKTLKKCEFIEIFESDSPYVLSVSFEGINGETMVHALEERGVIIGTGSACSAKKSGNRILSGIGFSNEKIRHSVRISFSFEQSEEEIEKAGNIIVDTYLNLRNRGNL